MNNEIIYKNIPKNKSLGINRNSDEKFDEEVGSFYDNFIIFVNNNQTKECLNILWSIIKKSNFSDLNFSSNFMKSFVHLINVEYISIMECILNLLKELIKNSSFADLFLYENGDILLCNLLNQENNCLTNKILDIFTKMKLSSDFPISNFANYFQENQTDYRFIPLVINCMDSTRDISLLFSIFLKFPEPVKESFNLYCRLIISFFLHGLDPTIFVESNIFEILTSFFAPDLSIQDLSFYLQIAAKLSSYEKIQNILIQMNPNIFFFLLTSQNEKKIIISVIVIIIAIMISEKLMKANEFISQFVTDSVIYKLIKNICDEQYDIKYRSLLLLNLFLKYSDNRKDKLEKVVEKISGEHIIALLSMDGKILIDLLQFIYYIFEYIKHYYYGIPLLETIKDWERYGIISTIQQLCSSDDNEVSEAATLLSQKIIPTYKLIG